MGYNKRNHTGGDGLSIQDDRRALHAIPELELSLPQTMAYLKQALSRLTCRVFSPIESALCAYFDFGKPDAIAFRADCDALPITECTNAPYASRIAGHMHACGHDGHMAILLELARRLSEKHTCAHNVLLVFQPGEEAPGGARLICESGVFETYGVRAIFGLHLWPMLPAGEIFSRESALMAHASELTVDVYGRSSHIAKASDGIDATAAAVEFYTRVRQAERAYPPEVFRLLNFGLVQSGTVRNAISAHCHMEGCLRAYRDEIFESLKADVFRVAKQVEAEFGATVRIHLSEGYPAVMNPPELLARVRCLAPVKMLDAPSMTAEDFGWYQKSLAGCFFFLGIGDTPALHASDFDFDDAILTKGADFFEKLAENGI